MNSTNTNQLRFQSARRPSFIQRFITVLYCGLGNGIVFTLCFFIPLFFIVFNGCIDKIQDKILRHLSESIETTPLPSIKDIYNYEYSFLNNITMIDYIGKWHNLTINNQSFFKENEGVVEMEFLKIKNKNYVFNHEANNSFNILFIIKNGKYKDHCITGNFSLPLHPNFIDDLKSVLQDNSTTNDLNITSTNTTISLVERELFYDSKIDANITNVTLSFTKHNKALVDSYNAMIISPFALANLTLEGDFSISIQTEIQISNEIELKVRNYSFILTILSLIDIYLIFKLLVEVNDNTQIGLNLDMVTILISILYKSFIATAHLFLSLTNNNEEISYEFGIPSIVSFLSFSLFEVRLLIFSWKARNIDLLFNNPNLFKRKMFMFYSLFYVLQFLSLMSVKTIFSSFWSCLLLFLSTWSFQIIHSIRTGTRPPMSNSHIVLSTLSKLFLPIYLKGYDGNAFELRPSYFKVTIIVLFVLIQMVIMMMQKKFGAKVIVPKCWKTLPYNYYRETINIDEHISHNPDCVICLEGLKENVDIEANAEEKTVINKTQRFAFIQSNLDKINKYFLSLSSPNKKQKFMITPCDHTYHSACLEKWMQLKNECPYCKRSIPPLE